jgi:hypothetical protein
VSDETHARLDGPRWFTRQCMFGPRRSPRRLRVRRGSMQGRLARRVAGARGRSRGDPSRSTDDEPDLYALGDYTEVDYAATLDR